MPNTYIICTIDSIETLRLNMVEYCQAQQTNKEQLSFPSQVPQPKWLAEESMNMNKQIVNRTNEENINMPSQPTHVNNEFVNYYVDVCGVY